MRDHQRLVDRRRIGLGGIAALPASAPRLEALISPYGCAEIADRSTVAARRSVTVAALPAGARRWRRERRPWRGRTWRRRSRSRRTWSGRSDRTGPSRSPGSAIDRDRRRRLRPRQRRIGGRGQRAEQREIGQRGQRAAGHDDRLPPDLVRQPAEDDEEGRRQRQRDGDQDVGGRAVDLERLLEEEQRVELPGVPDHRLPRDRADQRDDHDPQDWPSARTPRSAAPSTPRPPPSSPRNTGLSSSCSRIHSDSAEQQDRDQERDPPAPVGERLLAERGADADHHQQAPRTGRASRWSG